MKRLNDALHFNSSISEYLFNQEKSFSLITVWLKCLQAAAAKDCGA